MVAANFFAASASATESVVQRCPVNGHRGQHLFRGRVAAVQADLNIALVIVLDRIATDQRLVCRQPAITVAVASNLSICRIGFPCCGIVAFDRRYVVGFRRGIEDVTSGVRSAGR